MTKHREILRLSSMGLSQRSIASSCQCSRNTVSEVLNRANQKGLTWPIPEEVSDADLLHLLFPDKSQLSTRKVPDCEYMHRELAKSGVTLSLLWSEYCEVCRLSNEIPLKYTQYCNYYRKYAATTKATMHISRKPGEQLEVDWAGQTASIIDRDTGEIIPVYISLQHSPAASTPMWRASYHRIRSVGSQPTSMPLPSMVALPGSLCRTI